MDDDVIAGPGLVSAHARHHAGTHGLVVVGFMPVRLDEGSSSTSRLYATEYDEHCRRLESGELTVLDGLWLGNVSVRRDEVLRVGVPSEHFSVRWHADTDFGLRLRDAGERGIFDRRLVADAPEHRNRRPRSSRARTSGAREPGFSRHEHADAPATVRPAPVLDGLSGPSRVVVSLLGREGWSGWSSRALMGLAAVADRLTPTTCVRPAGPAGATDQGDLWVSLRGSKARLARTRTEGVRRTLSRAGRPTPRRARSPGGERSASRPARARLGQEVEGDLLGVGDGGQPTPGELGRHLELVVIDMLPSAARRGTSSGQWPASIAWSAVPTPPWAITRSA